MQKPLGDFIHALRQHGLPVSPAESLDAIQATRLIGLQCPNQLRQALGMTLAKTQDHLLILEQLFNTFFLQPAPTAETDAVHEAAEPKSDSAESTSTESSDDSEQAQGTDEDSPMSSSDKQTADAQPSSESTLGQQLMDNGQAALSMAIASAGAQLGAQKMQMVTQKNQMGFRIMKELGNQQLNNELAELSSQPQQQTRLHELQRRQRALQQEVREYVEQQYLLFSEPKGLALRTSKLQKIKLTNVDKQHQSQMATLIQQAAKKLASLHGRRRKVSKRGLLDVRRTIAANAAYDGLLFHTKWKATRVERPKVMVICDVSGSVSRVARFLLLFLYSLQDVLPKVRSFVFASEMGEVTDVFQQQKVESALSQIMAQWANRPTDYGRALEDFKRLALDEIDPKTTIIMLGDARNNKGDGRSDIWQQVYQRSQRVLWLNPEGQFNWDSGDSIMSEYAPYCSRTESCNSLSDLNRILSSLLKYS